MANFIKSFQQGMDVGNQFIDTLDRRERQKRADERNQVLQDRQDTLWQQGQEDRKQSLEDAKKARERDDIRFEREGKTFDLNNKATEQSINLQKEQHDQQSKLFDFNLKVKNREADTSFVNQNLINSATTGDYSWAETPEAQEVFKRNPHLNPVWATDNDTFQAASYLTNVINGMGNGQMPKWNDPKVMSSLDQLFPEIVNSTDLPEFTPDGKRITSRKISGVMPMKGGKVAIQLSITDEDGNTYDAPMTQNRSSDPNDNVAVVDFKYLTQRIGAINEAQSNDVYKKTREYLALQSGKGSKKDSRSERQKLQYQAENDLNKKFFDEETAIRNDMSLDEEQRKVKLAELDQRREREFAQLRTRSENTFGENITDLEGQERENKIDGMMTTVKNAFDRELTPVAQGHVRRMIQDGDDFETIVDYLNSPQNKDAFVSGRSASKSEEEDANKTLSGMRERRQKATEAQEAKYKELEQLVLDPNIETPEKNRLVAESDLPDEMKRKLRERVDYAGVYRAGNAIVDAYSEPSPLNSFKNRANTPRTF
ncbi:hypothetical protein [Vibrio owensii]|uniref:hypothetical protein n=1 Tax=Vibrio owensii TaxID=696485 RepID=UPI003CE4525B